MFLQRRVDVGEIFGLGVNDVQQGRSVARYFSGFDVRMGRCWEREAGSGSGGIPGRRSRVWMACAAKSEEDTLESLKSIFRDKEVPDKCGCMIWRQGTLIEKRHWRTCSLACITTTTTH
jgi:hypothetical protein